MQREERFEPWVRASREPNDEEKDTMFKKALEVALMIVLKNHAYEFNREIRNKLMEAQ